MSRPRDFGLREGPGTEYMDWFCTCGTELWPDCDISAASVVEEFQRHLRDDHGFTQAEIELELVFSDPEGET